MKPVSPVLQDPAADAVKAHEIVLGENQPQYVPLPALCQSVTVKDDVMSGPFVSDIRQANYVITRWELSDEDIARIVETKSIYLSTWKSVGEFFNPMALSTEAPIQATDITVSPVERLIDERERAMPIEETGSEGN